MRLEIERKFLLKNEAWRAEVVSRRHLKDGLISQTERGKVRVRIDGTAAWLTVKGARCGLTRQEYEYEIPLEDGERLIDGICIGQRIEKTRFCVPGPDRMWTVDAFHGLLEGLVWAEIELDEEEQRFAIPDWLGEEVTADPRFRQSNLLALTANHREPVSMASILASRPDAPARHLRAV